MKLKSCLFVFLALLLLRVAASVAAPVFETSEARYAAISANMARTGDFCVPHYTYRGEYQSFDGKPPLQFQASGLSARLLGVSPFAVRLPILTANLLFLLFLGWTVRRLARERGAPREEASARGLCAAGVCATCVAFYAYAGFCMPDALLLPAVGFAFLCQALFYATEDNRWTWGVAAALGLGMMTKGPVALVLFGLPAFLDACFNHRWASLRRMRWFSGTALFLAIAAPWFALMADRNPGFLSYFFINENLLRFVTHDYGDKYGSGREYFRGVAPIWLAVITLPWFPIAVARAAKVCRLEGTRALWRKFTDTSPASFLLWGVVGVTFFWCLTSRVPIGYMLPAVAPFAALFALSGRADAVRLPLRLLPWAAALAMVALTSVQLWTALMTDKMPGADAVERGNRYSYEFYNGPKNMETEVLK